MKLTYAIAILLTSGFAIGQQALAQQAPNRQDLQQRVDVLERQVRALSDMVLRLDTLTREMQQLRGEVELQSHAMDALKERQRDLYLDLDKRISKIRESGPATSTFNPTVPPSGTTTMPQATVAAAGALTGGPIESISTSGGALKPIPSDLPPGDPAEEDERYRAAFEMLRQGKYNDARHALRTFLIQYPDSDKADNAQYWLAEAGYVTKDFDTALGDFSSLIDHYPQSPKVADAMLKSGYILYESQRYGEARNQLKQLLKEHADTTAAQLAQKQLDRMDREGR